MVKFHIKAKRDDGTFWYPHKPKRNQISGVWVEDRKSVDCIICLRIIEKWGHLFR